MRQDIFTPSTTSSELLCLRIISASLLEQEASPTKYVYNYSQIDENHQRTPMCRIAELARYNKVRFFLIYLIRSD